MLVGTRRLKIFCRTVPSPRLAAVFELFLSPWIRHPWSSRTTLARRTRLLLSPSQAFLFTRPSASSAPHTVPHSTHPTFPMGHQSTDRVRITRRSSHDFPSRDALGFRYRNPMYSSPYPWGQGGSRGLARPPPRARDRGGALGGAFYSRLGRVHSRPRAWWSIKPMTVSYQRRALFGFRIQWFSSGK